jgi:hypothetical protein
MLADTTVGLQLIACGDVINTGSAETKTKTETGCIEAEAAVCRQF